MHIISTYMVVKYFLATAQQYTIHYPQCKKQLDSVSMRYDFWQSKQVGRAKERYVAKTPREAYHVTPPIRQHNVFTVDQ